MAFKYRQTISLAFLFKPCSFDFASNQRL
ncbi:unnamed protein product [Nezara viridula]|uniref:Uncharacterized protein n=1 Tax=Nezara viridula TaxID=85310 RepID=A0A9P0MR50_NEZVI|nr:unnamed protein product [Nezara viridula]